ncbi:glycosyltransferase family 4 protein [Streptomyces rugosispiralis]|uniref:D-inositol 3-phosphate glycosyltransferase n=1 Tax=Streptomyces rugosispiralis TaxID=2967341 RepID=A0ABT1V0L2_9ACTN|nr:glycosyltransferase family 4 protein [Streptomyces rugosispiralis]MCQ8190111.1 glycosyltransferase family 4 protein [Streptomyces rugosispiralis]
MKIAFLINNAFGIGGAIRSTLNLSSALVARHDVEVVSVHQVSETPALALDERVALTSLIDMREDTSGYEGRHELTRKPCTMFPDTGAAANSERLPYSALQDERIGTWLRHTDADVVIATRPDLNGYLARDGHSRYLRVGQEHLSLDAHDPTLRGYQNRAITDLDAFVTVSEADAVQYRVALPRVSTRIVCIPNGVPMPTVEPSNRRSNVIVAAGRLVEVKRYDRLIDAFAKVAADHPDWTLRLYGRGPVKSQLREQIDRLGLYGRVFLMGPVSPIETEWAKGAIAAVSSDMESFGMTIVEAMHCGVPVVATDCPHGPAEILDHDINGMLVPPQGGSDAYADALRHLMSDDVLRDRLGKAARKRARAFDPAVIARHYEQLFDDLRAANRPSLLRRLRSALHRAEPAEPTQHQRPAETAAESTPVTAPQALAYTRALPQGALRIRLAADTLPVGPLDFVIRLRKDPKGREVHLPIPEARADDIADPHITLPSGAALAEGRWDCYAAHRDTTTAADRVRLTAALTEQTALVGRPPMTSRNGVSACIPYTTSDGYLALRTWHRPAHAEVHHITVDATHTTITATLLGPNTDTDLTAATVVAVSRTAPEHDVTTSVTQITDRSFEFTLDYNDMLTHREVEHDLWDLRLRLNSPGDAAIPIGRIGGDVVDRKKTDKTPATHLPHPKRGMTRITPFFTVDNNLALSAKDIPEPTGEHLKRAETG